MMYLSTVMRLHISVLILWSALFTSASGFPTIHSSAFLRWNRQDIFEGWKRDESKRGFTEDERVAIVSIHNQIRKQMPAADMQRLHWSTFLEDVAQTWTEKCDFQHNQANDYGENLLALPSFYNETEAVNVWFSEGEHYNYANHTCDEGHTCAHFIQVVLAESTEIGCGITFCPNMFTITMTNAYFISCNYRPALNKGSSVPYEEGEVCSSCEEDFLCLYDMCDDPTLTTTTRVSTVGSTVKPTTSVSTSTTGSPPLTTTTSLTPSMPGTTTQTTSTSSKTTPKPTTTTQLSETTSPTATSVPTSTTGSPPLTTTTSLTPSIPGTTTQTLSTSSTTTLNPTTTTQLSVTTSPATTVRPVTTAPHETTTSPTSVEQSTTTIQHTTMKSLTTTVHPSTTTTSERYIMKKNKKRCRTYNRDAKFSPWRRRTCWYTT